MSLHRRRAVLVLSACMMASVGGWAHADKIDEYIAEATVQVPFLIVSSSTSYRDAKRVAARAAGLLNVKLDLRDLTFTKEAGFTHSKKYCTADRVLAEYPCYWPRGRYDDGDYVSIERSDGYVGFRPGLYIVIVKSGGDERDYPDALARARRYFPGAYIKKAPIFYGCIH